MEKIFNKIINENIEDMFNKLKELPSTGNTKLGSQILFMEGLSKIIKTPMTTSILNSLIELRNIKQKQIDKLKSELK